MVAKYWLSVSLQNTSHTQKDRHKKAPCPQGIPSLVGKIRHTKTPNLIHNDICKNYGKNRKGQSLDRGNLGRLLRQRGVEL